VSLSLLSLVFDADSSQGNSNLFAATAATRDQVDFVSFSMAHVLQYEVAQLIHYTVPDSMQGNTDDDYPSIDLFGEPREVFDDESTLSRGQDLQYSLVSHPSYRTGLCCPS
jgi:hypothetical protein